MNKDIAEYVEKCPYCQQVKVKHQKKGGLLQHTQVPTWKWEGINMGFVVGWIHTQKQYDSIWVVVDRLTKSARLIPLKSIYATEDYERISIDEIVCHHGIPLRSISVIPSLFFLLRVLV